MSEEFRLAWMVYAGGAVVLLLAGWWFMRNWGWGWLRWLLLATVAAALLIPARSGVPDAPSMPVLPLFVYQMVFEEEGATPEVTANLVFATGGAVALVALLGLCILLFRHRRERRREREEDPYFHER